MKIDSKEFCTIYTKQEIKDILFNTWIEWISKQEPPIEPGDTIRTSAGDETFILSVGTVMYEKIKTWIAEKHAKEMQIDLRRQWIKDHC